MLVNLRKFKYGACGESAFEIYKAENGDLLTECVQCQPTTRLYVEKPKINITFGPRSDGMVYLDD